MHAVFEEGRCAYQYPFPRKVFNRNLWRSSHGEAIILNCRRGVIDWNLLIELKYRIWGRRSRRSKYLCIANEDHTHGHCGLMLQMPHKIPRWHVCSFERQLGPEKRRTKARKGQAQPPCDSKIAENGEPCIECHLFQPESTNRFRRNQRGWPIGAEVLPTPISKYFVFYDSLLSGLPLWLWFWSEDTISASKLEEELKGILTNRLYTNWYQLDQSFCWNASPNEDAGECLNPELKESFTVYVSILVIFFNHI